MNLWELQYDDYDTEQERLREALCTLGNGYLGSRGAAPEYVAGENHYPGTYIGGLYNRLTTEISDVAVQNESLVNLPNWLPLTFRIDGGAWFTLEQVTLHHYRQRLLIRDGILEREVRFEDGAGRICRYILRRIVHMGDPHVVALSAELIAENWSGKVTFRVGLDARVRNANVERYSALKSEHLEYTRQGFEDDGSAFIHVRTNHSHIEVAYAARSFLYRDNHRLSLHPAEKKMAGYVGAHYSLDVDPGCTLRLEKLVAIHSDRDAATYECVYEALKQVRRLDSFAAILASHRRWWHQLWDRFDFHIECSDEKDQQQVTRILRLHIFHVLQTGSPNNMDLDTGIPARGLHGEAYRGHIFWDELFVFPILNLRLPEITRALLRYRYRRLDEARAAATAAGYEGAMYPWQSGSDGREESQHLHLNPRSGRWIPDNSRLQRHVGAAIAYNIWHYYQVTKDTEFLAFYGAEMFLEIARFWASIAQYNEERGRYEICAVMGPDEYHEAYPDAEQPGLDNNAYTNAMAAWVLWRVPDILGFLPEGRRAELREYINLQADELERWEHISRHMFIPFHGDGIISQFEGYERLRELDWEAYHRKYGDVQRLDRILEAEQDTPNRYKASKQADVVMLFYLFSAGELESLFSHMGYGLSREALPRNIEYYMERTSHGSTLSRVVHSWVMSRIDRKRSWTLFNRALPSDVSDVQGGTTPEGVHLGAMAGTVDIMQRCYTGVETRDDVLWLNPRLPEELKCLSTRFHYRGHHLELTFTQDHVTITSGKSRAEAIRIGHEEDIHELGPDERLRLELTHG